MGTTKQYGRVRKPSHHRADTQGKVRKSVLVMEAHIGRFMQRGEEIHHINNDTTDDRIENLLLTTHSEHRRLEKNVKNKYETAKLQGES